MQEKTHLGRWYMHKERERERERERKRVRIRESQWKRKHGGNFYF